MAIDLALLKKHPYATGGIVIVGGIVVYYLLSSSSSGQSTSSAYGQALSADTALGQAQAGVAVQTAAQQAQIQQAQIAAQVQNTQTSAAEDVSNTQTLAALAATLYGGAQSTEVAQINANAETLQQANSETSEQNIYALQEGGLQAQINEQYNENANNNATSLAGLVDQLNAQGDIASQTIAAATGLASQQQADYQSDVQQILPLAGQQKNSALDATDQTALFQTILSGGNPAVAVSGNTATSTATVSGNGQASSILNSISKLGSSIGAGLFSGA
jgi:membrane-associated protease RseP (regulator of RpoE activity)